MADDNKRKSAPKRAGAGTGGTGVSGSGSRAGGGGARGGPGGRRGAPGAEIDERKAGGSGARAGNRGDAPTTAAELGGSTADGDGLTAATLTAASLGDAALAESSEPIVIVESITVLSETPLELGRSEEAFTDEAAMGDTLGGGVDPEQRWLMIAERAYLRAAERGFAPGGELADWLGAEQEVDARLAGR